MDIWAWLKQKQASIRELLEDNGVKGAKKEALTTGINDLMFEAYNLGKECQKEESNKS